MSILLLRQYLGHITLLLKDPVLTKADRNVSLVGALLSLAVSVAGIRPAIQLFSCNCKNLDYLVPDGHSSVTYTRADTLKEMYPSSPVNIPVLCINLDNSSTRTCEDDDVPLLAESPRAVLSSNV